jgi:GNAT superfamily N-acetyltransferase
MASMLSLRPATRDDVSTLLRFIRELADYEREPDAVVATEEDLLRDGFGDAPRFHAILAEWEGTPVGFAFYFFQYSTWTGRPTLYLEDLFVTPGHRKRGIGVALMRRLAREALRAGCKRFQWAVLDWNEPAFRFYEALGARVIADWRTVRIDGDAIAALAEES